MKHFEDRRAPEALEEPLLWEVKALGHQLELFEEQIRQVEGRIEREMAGRKSLVTTAPGIGPITAAIIESELGDAKWFENAKPGESVRRPRPARLSVGEVRRGPRPHLEVGEPLAT